MSSTVHWCHLYFFLCFEIGKLGCGVTVSWFLFRQNRVATINLIDIINIEAFEALNIVNYSVNVIMTVIMSEDSNKVIKPL